MCSSLVDLDNKLRFFWTIGKAPSQTDFSQLYADPVIPDGFPEWQTVMDSWGALLLATATTIAEMYAQGLGLSVDTFTSLMEYSSHLLGPTGTDLARFGKLGTVLASFHYDLGFLTIHGRARFPGLFVWTREGKRVAVEVPYGCLLFQAGIEFEWLTGGQVLAGFHEVVVSEQTVKKIDEASQAGRSLWRVSSTLFTGIASDQVLQPLKPFATAETVKMYPPTTAGAQLLAELEAINLAKTLD